MLGDYKLGSCCPAENSCGGDPPPRLSETPIFGQAIVAANECFTREVVVQVAPNATVCTGGFFSRLPPGGATGRDGIRAGGMEHVAPGVRR
jgi:hypothetical protein